VGQPLHQDPVGSVHSRSQHHLSDFRSFQLPNPVLPHTSNRYTQYARLATITKLFACDDFFGVLSAAGELFIFSLPEPKATSGGEKLTIKPQLVWTLRKAFTAVKVSRGFSAVTNANIYPVGLLNGGRWVYYPLHGLWSRLLANEEPQNVPERQQSLQV